MSEYTKHLIPRPELRERIIDTAVEGLCCARYQKYYNG